MEKVVHSHPISENHTSMKHNIIRDNKNLLGIIGAILCFALITLIYFNPVLQGKRIKQHDIEMYRGMSHEIVEYKAQTGEQSLWTNSMFGGMPAWNIGVSQNSNLMTGAQRVLTLGFPHPIGSVFISMLGFFILLLVLDCSIGISAVGALAYGFTSYLFIVIGAGHNSKAMAMAYMAPVIAGILLTYKGKYLWGSVLTALALALQIRAGHLQITYYLFLTVLCLVIAQLVEAIRCKSLGNFFKASGLLTIAAFLAVLTCSTTLYANYKYGQETMRGKPILTQNQDKQTKGLERDYITQWSYGKGETWTLLIPNAKGGASGYIGKDEPALEKADPRFKESIAQSNAYWGDQPGTSGPVYVGAIVVFLFLLGAFTVKGGTKWALVAATLLSILLSWGKNMMWFTDFFIDYIPGYNKFRAVSMTLVIAEVCMPLLGFLGLAEILKNPDSFKQNIKKFYIALGITAGFCLLFSVAPKAFFSFLSQGEAEQFESISAQYGNGVYALASQLEDVRVAIFRKDALRSLLFIILAAVPIFLCGKNKLKALPATLILAALVVIDLYPIDRRYLNNDNFISKKLADRPFTATKADKYILQDSDPDFRVINLTKDVFNDASTSYYHKSIGGYNGAKLRRYQDVITQYLSVEVKRFGNIFNSINTEDDFGAAMQQQKVLNMLNTRYVIYNPDVEPLVNPCAMGNAWAVNDIRWVETPNEEIDAIASTDVAHTAIISKDFQSELQGFVPSDAQNCNISLDYYKPNEVAYNFNSGKDQLVVFSEIWTQTDGWHLFIDGKEHPILRANYLLRAAMVPAGTHNITMSYTPSIWKTGNTLQLASSLLLLIGLAAACIVSFKKKKSEAVTKA